MGKEIGTLMGVGYTTVSQYGGGEGKPLYLRQKNLKKSVRI
jgi:hypothetical protein